MKTRRFFLGSVASAAALAQQMASASAFSWRSGVPRQLTTITIVNRSHHDVDAGAITQIVGCPFRKGDIPSGEWPQFQLQDGSAVACTFLSALATTWSDRSLKFVPVMLQLPVAIEAQRKVVVNVLSGGALSQDGGRSLADLQAGIAPQVQVDGLDHLTGTWIMDLGEGITHGTKIVTYGTGPAGAVWKVRARAQQNGALHKNLVCDFYVAALSNLDGSLKGIRIIGKVKLPYYDTTSTMNWMSFSRLQLYANNSGTLIRDCFGNNFGAKRSYTFAWVSGPNFAANHGYSTANYGDYSYCTRLTSNGNLPAGLSPNVSYFTCHPTSTTIQFSTSSTSQARSVSATDPGAGVHTATPYPYLCYFGSLFTAGPTGRWDFLQGAGSDSTDTALHCQINKKYWVSTGLIPSYDIHLKAVSNAPATYWPNSAEPVTRYLSTTGERDDLGIMPAWYVRHFLSQAVVDEQVVRVVSLVGGQFAIGLETWRKKTMPCVNNGSDGNGRPYSGMPVPNPNFYWSAATGTVGFTDTTDKNVNVAGFSEQDTTHMPQFNYYPYLFTGEPWHLDMLLEHANNAVYQRTRSVGVANISDSSYSLGSNGGGVRNLSVGSNPTRYGITIGDARGQQRTDAWASGLLVSAAAICPDTHPECASYKRYFTDMNSATWCAAMDIQNVLPAYAKAHGLWSTPYEQGYPVSVPWQMAYLGTALALAASATENRNAALALHAHIKWFDYVVSQFGGWHVGAFHALVKGGNDTGAPLVDSARGIAFDGAHFNWIAGGHFTALAFSNYVPANGDKVIFGDTVGSDPKVTPAGFEKYTPYFMVNVFGTLFDLAPTQGGGAIPLTDSYSGNDAFYIVSSTPPATGSITAIGSPTSYNTEIVGMLNYASAVGVSAQPATLADLTYRNQAAGLTFSSNPKWAMVKTFH